MAVREWTVETPVPHHVRLEHGYCSGRARVFVDERLVFERPTTFWDHGFEHQLSIGGVPCVVRVSSNGLAFSYSLTENETLPEPDPQPATRSRHAAVRRTVMATTLALFAVLWCCVGLNVLPLRGVPPRGRTFYLLLGLLHVPVLVWYLLPTRPKRPSSPEG